eukprot:3832880-Lingulodinium_polyedra.AAC.1
MSGSGRPFKVIAALKDSARDAEVVHVKLKPNMAIYMPIGVMVWEKSSSEVVGIRSSVLHG